MKQIKLNVKGGKISQIIVQNSESLSIRFMSEDEAKCCFGQLAVLQMGSVVNRKIPYAYKVEWLNNQKNQFLVSGKEVEIALTIMEDLGYMSENTANQVKDKLADFGIAPSRFFGQGFVLFASPAEGKYEQLTMNQHIIG